MSVCQQVLSIREYWLVNVGIYTVTKKVGIVLFTVFKSSKNINKIAVIEYSVRTYLNAAEVIRGLVYKLWVSLSVENCRISY